MRIGSCVVGFGKDGWADVSAGEVSELGGGGCAGKEAGSAFEEVVAEEAPGEIGEIDADIGDGGKLSTGFEYCEGNP